MSDYDTRKTLLQRVRDQHDEQSWEDFVKFYERFIFSIIHNMGIDPFTCDDLIQKVILKLWKSLPEFDYTKEKGGFRNWLFRVTRNTVRTHLGKQIRRQDKFNNDYMPQEAILNDQAQSADVEKWIEREWQEHICKLAYDRVRPSISEKVHEAFQMYMDDIPVEEIGKKLNMNPSNVYVYTKRVRDKLLKEIKYLRSELE